MKKQTTTQQQSSSNTKVQEETPNSDSTPDLTVEQIIQFIAIRYRGKSFEEGMGLMIHQVFQQHPELIPKS